MSGIATAIGASALLGAGATMMSANATTHAANTAAGAQNNATAEQGREFDTTQQNFAPYKAIGEAAAPQFTNFINSGGGNITSDPLYQNQMQAATREATQRAAGSGQSSQSGAMQTRLAQLGDQIYNNTYQTKYQEITDALKTGQGAAGSIAGAGTQLGWQQQQGAQNLGNIAMNNANTQSSLYGGITGNLSALATGAMGRLNGVNGGGSNWWNGSSGGGVSNISSLGSADGSAPPIVNQASVSYE